MSSRLVLHRPDTRPVSGGSEIRPGARLAALGLMGLMAAVGVVRIIGAARSPSVSMRNQVQKELRSPDGRYVATFAYRDGLATGFFYVCVQPASRWEHLKVDAPIPDHEMVEMTPPGPSSVAWTGSHTLRIVYQESGAEDVRPYFLKREETWRDIRVEYVGS